MFCYESVSLHHHLSGELTVIQGNAVTDFGTFKFIKLRKKEIELCFSLDEFKWLLTTLTEKKDRRLAAPHKNIYVISPVCVCKKYVIEVRFSIYKLQLELCEGEKERVLKMVKIINPPNMSNESERLASFEKWPLQFPPISDLVKAGFFYLNKNDTVKCFYCGGLLCNWNLGDNPINEHLKYYPHCRYAKSIQTGKTPPPIGRDVVD